MILNDKYQLRKNYHTVKNAARGKRDSYKIVTKGI